MLGVPFHVVVGARGLQSGEVELKRRRDGTEERLPIDRAVRAIAERVRAELDGTSDRRRAVAVPEENSPWRSVGTHGGDSSAPANRLLQPRRVC